LGFPGCAGLYAQLNHYTRNNQVYAQQNLRMEFRRNIAGSRHENIRVSDQTWRYVGGDVSGFGRLDASF